MNDTLLMVEIPEALLARAQAANIDLRDVIIETLERMTPVSKDAIMHAYAVPFHP